MNKSIIAVILLSSAINTAYAEVVLDPIVITATRTAQAQSTTLSSVTLISRVQIEDRIADTVFDILQTQSGIDVARTGGPGQTVSVFMRGTESDHTLVLIDGVRVSSATSGGFAWHNLPASQIEKIEIVRGPRASLYGSEAIGGVIQIFTRKVDGATIRAEMGSFDTQSVELGWGISGAINASINVEFSETDGFSAQNENGLAFHPDDDGSRRKSVGVNLDTRVGQGTVYLQVLHTEQESHFDNVAYDPPTFEPVFFDGILELTNQSISAGIDFPLSSEWNTSFQVGHARDLNKSIDFSETNTRRSTASFVNDVQVSSATSITTGIDYYHENGERIDTPTATETYDKTVNNVGIFAHVQSQIGKQTISAALRRDKHSTLGMEVTGSIAVGHRINDHLQLRASWGTAFKAPNFNDLFSPGSGSLVSNFGGNPDLDPETSITTEIGLDAQISARQKLALSVYETRIKDLIGFDTNAPRNSVNVGRASINGIEVEWSNQWGPWQASANLTAQKAINLDTNTDLLRRPRRKLSTRVGHDIGTRGQANIEIVARSDFRDFGAFAEEDVPGSGVVNLDGYYEFAPQWRAEIRIENLLDKNYEIVRGFSTAERSAYVAVRYAMGG